MKWGNEFKLIEMYNRKTNEDVMNRELFKVASFYDEFFQSPFEGFEEGVKVVEKHLGSDTTYEYASELYDKVCENLLKYSHREEGYEYQF